MNHSSHTSLCSRLSLIFVLCIGYSCGSYLNSAQFLFLRSLPLDMYTSQSKCHVETQDARLIKARVISLEGAGMVNTGSLKLTYSDERYGQIRSRPIHRMPQTLVGGLPSVSEPRCPHPARLIARYPNTTHIRPHVSVS